MTAGSTVTWVNNGSTAVTVTSPDGLFDSETIAAGGSFSYTFDTPGTFRYFCVPYPHMKGVITVLTALTGGSSKDQVMTIGHFAGRAALALAGQIRYRQVPGHHVLRHRPGPRADASRHRPSSTSSPSRGSVSGP